ncbi:hypothetical protein Tco_0949778, partial [Tanacetum coccineum]
MASGVSRVSDAIRLAESSIGFLLEAIGKKAVLGARILEEKWDEGHKELDFTVRKTASGFPLTAVPKFQGETSQSFVSTS